MTPSIKDGGSKVAKKGQLNSCSFAKAHQGEV
jgi:hypothetical protein